jgi:serine phosphatase RsbU (regulator of sigma subunit)
MLSRWSSGDTQAVTAGLVALATVTVVYPLIAEEAARPLGVFVLPCLLTAVLGGWRPTVVVSGVSTLIAVVFGVASPLGSDALLARWLIVAVGATMAVIGAAVREHQAGRLAELDETMVLREAFERTLAPKPAAPAGFVAAARYQPADARMHLGGDFLEAIGLNDRRLGVLIGDVCGHGPREAAFGAALRAGWKAIALAGKDDPGDWVAAVHDAFFRDGRIDTFVTMFTGYLDLDDGIGRFVNAGHPQPVLLEPPARFLETRPVPPLGTGLGGAWTATDVIWDGQPLLFYTDGLIENPRTDGPAQRWGSEGLLDWLESQALDRHPDEVLDHLLAAASRERDARDDIAMLMVGAAGRRRRG